MKWFAVLLLCTASAYANPPPGSNPSPEEKAWWQCQYQIGGASCCGIGDGHLLNDDEWRSSGTGYQVLIEGDWLPVPPTAMVRSPCGPGPTPATAALAKVWYDSMRNILCFEVGTLF